MSSVGSTSASDSIAPGGAAYLTRQLRFVGPWAAAKDAEANFVSSRPVVLIEWASQLCAGSRGRNSVSSVVWRRLS